MKHNFQSQLAHEMRTLSAAIFACTDLLAAVVRSHPEAMNLVGTLRSNSRHLLNLMNNALDLAKIDTGQLHIDHLGRCEPGQLLTEIVCLLQPTAAEKAIRLHAICDGPIPQSIRTDSMRLRQILINLVDNALRFTDHGQVTLTARLQADVGSDSDIGEDCEPRLIIAVRDTGIGIPADRLEKIFEPFEQAEHDTARRYGGTGLGLTICRELVNLLGSKLTVESKSDEGTTFTIAIPTGCLDDTDFIDDLPQLRLLDRPATRGRNRRQNTKLDGVLVALAESRPERQLLASVILKSSGATIRLATDEETLCQIVTDNSTETSERKTVQAVPSSEQSPESVAPCDANSTPNVVVLSEATVTDPLSTFDTLRQRGYRGPVIVLSDSPPPPIVTAHGEGNLQWLSEPIDIITLTRAVAAALNRTSPKVPVESNRVTCKLSCS